MPFTRSSEPEIRRSERRREQRNHVEQLGERISELAAHIHAANYRLLELIRAFDECEGWNGFRSCAHWLNWRCGTSLGAAREKVRVSHALAHLPRISEEFREGRISYSKVRAMTRVATAENEEVLLNVALHGTAAHVERQVRLYRRHKRLEALERENRRHDLRELNWFCDENEGWILKGRFTPEQGALIQSALESVMEELFDESRNVSAETPQPNTGPRSEPMGQRRADAMVRLVEKVSDNAAVRCCVHVHTDRETLKEDGTGAESELEGQRHVPAETSRRLACDASVVHWLEGGDGEPLDIGRKSRTVPTAMRRALHRRDGGCRFPGCTCERWVDAHHIEHWADGGETKMGNLVLLCRRHHRLVHEGGYGIELRPGDEIRFTDADGRHLPNAGQGRSRGNVLALMTANAEEGIDITPNTAVPSWHGEVMDDSLAVLGLIQRE